MLSGGVPTVVGLSVDPMSPFGVLFTFRHRCVGAVSKCPKGTFGRTSYKRSVTQGPAGLTDPEMPCLLFATGRGKGACVRDACRRPGFAVEFSRDHRSRSWDWEGPAPTEKGKGVNDPDLGSIKSSHRIKHTQR